LYQLLKSVIFTLKLESQPLGISEQRVCILLDITIVYILPQPHSLHIIPIG